MRVVTTYDQVSEQGYKRGKCRVCGRVAERQQTFTNTVNPFNRGPDGEVRSWAEVRACVVELRKAWEAEPVVHARCEGGEE